MKEKYILTGDLKKGFRISKLGMGIQKSIEISLKLKMKN
jgi:hypothetical protein